MNRLRELERYPKLLLIVVLVMAVVFAGVYGIITARVGFAHNGGIFVPRQEGDVTLYEAELDGQDWRFTVTADTVTLTGGSKTYGPYILREDPTAVPEEDSLAPYMTGCEILDGSEVCFRGGVMENSGDLYLFHEDGSLNYGTTYTLSDGIEYDMDGSPIDHMKPTPYQIISLLRGPEPEHKGHWELFFMGLFLSLITSVSILFADELFYLSICFRVENAETAEPSDWYIISRNFGWLLLTIITGAVFLMGLQ